MINHYRERGTQISRGSLHAIAVGPERLLVLGCKLQPIKIFLLFELILYC